MDHFQKLTEIEDAILRYTQSKKPSEEKLVAAFVSKIYTDSTVRRMIKSLADSRGYIKLSDKRYHKPGVYFLDSPHNNEDWQHVYQITPLGKAYLARSSAIFTSYANITNSNIAHHSPNANQSIDITELPEDLREKVAEFDAAMKQKDSNAMKKAFGYIADKSVDVAIALATGALTR